MELGEIRKYIDDDDTERMCIVGLDAVEVFYDAWWDHNQNWGFAKSRSISFYRTSRDFFESNTVKMDLEPISDKDLTKYRPDLLQRIAILPKWQWNKKQFTSLQDFEKSIGKHNMELLKGSKLNAPKIFLIPHGPKGGSKQGVVIEADDGCSLSAIELLWKAHNIQSKFNTCAKDGVGIYRQGLKNGIPSYYLWERYDRAGNNKPQ